MGARPDLAGYDESGREHVLIEAKFEAKLTKKQRDGTYLNQLRNPLTSLWPIPLVFPGLFVESARYAGGASLRNRPEPPPSSPRPAPREGP